MEDIFKGISLEKLKVREKFSKNFPCKFTPALVLHVLYLKGISFNKIDS